MKSFKRGDSNFCPLLVGFVFLGKLCSRARQACMKSHYLDAWEHLYFVAHAKKAGKRHIIQRLHHFSKQCKRSWLGVLDRFMYARLSCLEKEKLSQFKGQHRLAVRCGQEDVDGLFVRVISGFGEYATSRYFKFVLRCLVRCRYLSLSKRRFTHLIRAFRSFVVWRSMRPRVRRSKRASCHIFTFGATRCKFPRSTGDCSRDG